MKAITRMPKKPTTLAAIMIIIIGKDMLDSDEDGPASAVDDEVTCNTRGLLCHGKRKTTRQSPCLHVGHVVIPGIA
jgi:hypothetical protein